MVTLYFYLLLALFLITGMSVGSFLNVVIYRLPRMIYGEEAENFSLAWPGSHCPACREKIRWYDNIPLLSWLLLRRRCRYCRQPISGRYPLIECVVGLYFVGLFLVYSWREPPEVLLSAHFFYALLPGLVLFCCVWCICFIDIQHYLIPDGLSLGLLWSGLLFASVKLIDLPLDQTLIACAVVWLLLTLLQNIYFTLRKKQGLGSGDVKLFVAAVPWLGWQKLPALIFFSALCGAACYIAFTLYRRRQSAHSQSADQLADKVQFADDAALDGNDANDANDGNENFADVLPCHFPFGPAIAVTLLILFFLP